MKQAQKAALKQAMLAAIETQAIERAFEQLLRCRWNGGYLLSCPSELEYLGLHIYPMELSRQVSHNQTTVRKYLDDLAAERLVDLQVLGKGYGSKHFKVKKQMGIEALHLVAKFIEKQGFEICKIKDRCDEKVRPNPPDKSFLPKSINDLREMVGRQNHAN